MSLQKNIKEKVHIMQNNNKASRVGKMTIGPGHSYVDP